jgi:hypothetical protein
VATRKQRNERRSELILQAIDKTIADVGARGGSGAAEKLDALRELRERVAAQLLDEHEPTRARPSN